MISNSYASAELHQHRNRQYCRKLRAIVDIAVPSSDVSASGADIVAANDECLIVSQCFKCFMMFY